jgi:hypothetical protein
LLKPEIKLTKRNKAMKKVSRAKASDALGKMMGKAIAARAAGAGGAGPSPMGAVPMGAPATPPMGMKKGGSAKKMASGGSFRSSANGIAKKGKTKGKQITMKNGGKC